MQGCPPSQSRSHATSLEAWLCLASLGCSGGRSWASKYGWLHRWRSLPRSWGCSCQPRSTVRSSCTQLYHRSPLFTMAIISGRLPSVAHEANHEMQDVSNAAASSRAASLAVLKTVWSKQLRACCISCSIPEPLQYGCTDTLVYRARLAVSLTLCRFAQLLEVLRRSS